MLAVAVLAAGKGTRMKSTLPKVLQPLGGKSLVERVLNATDSLQADRRIAIVGYCSDLVREALASYPHLEFAEQAEQLGTGHAIQQLLEPLAGFEGELVVLTGDSPLMRAETIQALIDSHRQHQASATVLTAILPNPTGYGRVFCDRTMQIERIIEHRDCNPEQILNQRVSTGVYCFDWSQLALALPKLTTNNAQKEYYLTEVFDYLTSVYASDLEDPDESLGINDRLQLAHAYAVLQKRARDKWMRAGVTMLLPETITIDDEVELAPNVTIEPHSHLRGNTKVSAGTTIGPSSLIENSIIGENCSVQFSVIEDSQIADNCRIGPFARIRGESIVGEKCRIGNFVELKNAKVGNRTNAAHLSYLGDATIGQQVNIGAGTITANYDGFKKHQTTIGDRSKTGSNSVLVAPIQIGENVNIAAGSIIVEDVADNSLAIARSPQVTKPDYYDPEGRKKIKNKN
ncbi:bifunctional UDP-N-acetylglucosamine diphosphorylase/glucosamine-1-phosphate N-acetyltransferase GlmU [Pseudanabaena sp. UWO310]|uniref:bifunctional UDP-N-acetylglucosamine diphosphorylase/glucosamine-1-phosphate N-acetyltransferase GlmU n=1 Tax=Pseudanabaena sp. UWO310 TaxID=2480795 RepID=UPI0011571AE9|nr:bifunctional UDP-N-acetylglucosamine diphosphorylase/glucosamine-1-phosphate N-acetyltransferase GlmU [Pseudanabaena sp. UWO310]TYQ30802.1 bifunctional UDP-N-acetylglucosamine diphosphorylase/glucosamine-1-phosphate N-acetyltransferase GlmU [Pseudanabaena sp. UWO310]